MFVRNSTRRRFRAVQWRGLRPRLTHEVRPITVISLHDAARKAITRAFLARTLNDGGSGVNFEGISPAEPSPALAGLRADEEGALAWYERTFSVRQVDAYFAAW